jgi:carbamoyl-phosphate synthase small subunit
MKLRLEDGTEMLGAGIPGTTAVAGEVVFCTAMTGYIEALTDPSYAGQILVFTYPLIGNYGVGRQDVGSGAEHAFQSQHAQVQGVIMQRLSRHYSHHLATESLRQWLREADVPILTGLDTRQLTQRLRSRGTMFGWIFPSEMPFEDAAANARTLDMRTDVFQKVTCAETVTYDGGDLRVLLVDTGIKQGIIDNLRARGATVIRAPWSVNLRALATEVDAIMLANGPGDPADLEPLVVQVRELAARFGGPILGVCLGHQILARAAGFPTYKLQYGHRGVNQPVRQVDTGRCFVTSQNHGFAVDDKAPPHDWERWFENLNDRTNEGIRSRSKPFCSVQFHPEGKPGPRDTEFLFDDFIGLATRLRRSITGCP